MSLLHSCAVNRLSVGSILNETELLENPANDAQLLTSYGLQPLCSIVFDVLVIAFLIFQRGEVPSVGLIEKSG